MKRKSDANRYVQKTGWLDFGRSVLENLISARKMEAGKAAFKIRSLKTADRGKLGFFESEAGKHIDKISESILHMLQEKLDLLGRAQRSAGGKNGWSKRG